MHARDPHDYIRNCLYRLALSTFANSKTMATPTKREYIHVSNAYDVSVSAPSQLAASGAVRLLSAKQDPVGRCYIAYGMGADPSASATFTVGDLVWQSTGSADQQTLLVLCTDPSGSISWAMEITGGLAFRIQDHAVALSQPCDATGLHAHIAFVATSGYTYRINTYSRSLLDVPSTLHFPPLGHKLNPASVKDSAIYIPNCPTAMRQTFEITDADMRLLGAAQGGGTYTVTCVYGGRTIWNRPVCMLDGDPITYYNGDVLVHDNLDADGPYAFNVRTCVWDGSFYVGEWIQIDLPVAIKVSGYKCDPAARGAPPDQVLPAKHVLLGSMDGISWVLLDSRSGYAWGNENVLGITHCFPMFKFKFRCFRFIPLLAKRGAMEGYGIRNFQLLADPDETFGVPRLYPPTVIPYVPQTSTSGMVCTQRVTLGPDHMPYGAGDYIASTYPAKNDISESHGPMVAFNGIQHDVFFFRTADVSRFFPAGLNGAADLDYARSLKASLTLDPLLTLPYLQIVFPEAFVPETLYLVPHALYLNSALPRTFAVLASKSSSPSESDGSAWDILEKRDGATRDVFYVFTATHGAAYCTYRLVFTSVAPVGFAGFFSFSNVAFSTTASVQAKEFPPPAMSDTTTVRTVRLAEYGADRVMLSEERIAYRAQDCIVTAPIDESVPSESWAAASLLSGRNGTYRGRLGVYDASGRYTGSVVTALGGTSVFGDFVQMYFGTPIAPIQLVMEADSSDISASPRQTHLFASKDGRRWHLVSAHLHAAPVESFAIATDAQAVPCSWWRVVFGALFPSGSAGPRGVRLSKLGFRLNAGLTAATVSSPLIANPMGELRPSPTTALSIGIEENPGTRVGGYFEYAVAASSSFSEDRREWNAFSTSDSKYWLSNLNYSAGSGLYYGSHETSLTSGAVVPGEWIEVTLPSAIRPCALLIHPLQLSVYGMTLSEVPVDWKLLATAQVGAAEPQWDVVASVDGDYSPWPADKGVTVEVSSESAYRRYRLVIRRVAMSQGRADVISNVGIALKRFLIFSRKSSALECIAVDVRSGAMDWRASVLGDGLTGVAVQSINHIRASDVSPPHPLASVVLSFAAAGSADLGSWTFPGGETQGSNGAPLRYFVPNDIYMFSSTHTQRYLESLAGNCHVHVVSCAQQTYSLGVNNYGKLMWNMCSRVPGRIATQRFEHMRTCNVFKNDSASSIAIVAGYTLLYANVMTFRAPAPMSNFTYSSLENLLNGDVNTSSGDFYMCDQNQSYIVLHLVEYTASGPQPIVSQKFTQTRSDTSFLVLARGVYALTRASMQKSKLYLALEPAALAADLQSSPNALYDTDLALPLKTWPARVRIQDASGCSLIIAAFDQSPSLRSNFLQWTVQLLGQGVATSVLLPNEYSGTASGSILVAAMAPSSNGPLHVIGTQYTRLAPTGRLEEVSDSVLMGQGSAYQAVLWSFGSDALPTSYPFKLLGRNVTDMHPLHKDTDDGLTVLVLPADASGAAIAYSGLPNVDIWRAKNTAVPRLLRVGKKSIVVPKMLDRSRMGLSGGQTAIVTCEISVDEWVGMFGGSSLWRITASIDGALESVGADRALATAASSMVQTCECRVESYASVVLRDYVVPLDVSGLSWGVLAKYDTSDRAFVPMRPLDPAGSKVSVFRRTDGTLVSPCQPGNDFAMPVILGLDASGSIPVFNIAAHGDRYARYSAAFADALLVLEGDPTASRRLRVGVANAGQPQLSVDMLGSFVRTIHPDLKLAAGADGERVLELPVPMLETRSSVNLFPLDGLPMGAPWTGIDSAVVGIIGTFMQAPNPKEPLDVTRPWARELGDGTVRALSQHLRADSTWSDVFKNALGGSDGQTIEYILKACSDDGLPINAELLTFTSPMELYMGLTDIAVEASYDNATSGEKFYSFLFDIPVLLRFKHRQPDI